MKYLANTEVETREDRFIKKIKGDYPAHQMHKSAPIMHRIRSVKEQVEIELLQRACKITEAGVRRLLKYIKPGVWEYEIEAELAHEFLRSRSQGFAYTPIIASGKNACVLHFHGDIHIIIHIKPRLTLDIGQCSCNNHVRFKFILESFYFACHHLREFALSCATNVIRKACAVSLAWPCGL